MLHRNHPHDNHDCRITYIPHRDTMLLSDWNDHKNGSRSHLPELNDNNKYWLITYDYLLQHPRDELDQSL